MLLTQARTQVESPFSSFDAIFCLNLDDQRDRWREMNRRFQLLDIAWRVERFPAVKADHGCTRSFRLMVEEARRRGYVNMLVLEDDAMFLDQTLPILSDAVADSPGSSGTSSIWAAAFGPRASRTTRAAGSCNGRPG